MKLSFQKMHGTGNDFVVLDGRKHTLALDEATITRLCDRHFGIGCDTLVLLGNAEGADVAATFYNSDGSISPTCGNASRCVADIVMEETGKTSVRIATGGGVLEARRAEGGGVTVNMGAPKLNWQQIPLSESRNTLHLGLEEGLLRDPVAVNMGNPHAIFFVRDLHHIKMGEWGPKLEHNPLFPQRANISAVQVLSPSHVKMVVWERGVGLTLACGSAACAAVVAGVERETLARQCTVEVPGGSLSIDYTASGEVLMSGPVAYVFNGEIDL